ncbi:MAG: hypothetical protein AB7T86_08385 [Xanthobacteraceae bacterium]|uniref:hypothetical protein n=1 Tax=Pseudolabrys sp. TaxID=1960880 RepID=UPI003D114926
MKETPATNQMQTGGYVTGFRVGEMILENGGKLPIVELEYRPHPASSDQEAMSVQLALRSEVANRLLRQLKQKIDDIEDRKSSMN